MAKVELYVYDLSRGMAKSMSQMLTGKQIDGIWLVIFRSVQWRWTALTRCIGIAPSWYLAERSSSDKVFSKLDLERLITARQSRRSIVESHTSIKELSRSTSQRCRTRTLPMRIT